MKIMGSFGKKRLRMTLMLIVSIFFSFPKIMYADFELMDSIKEFGEKRYVDTAKRGGIKTGPLRVHPSLRTRSAYDSNIVREPDDPHDDIVWSVLPGAILELPVGPHQLSVGYEADFEFFTKDKNARQNDQNQSFFVLADIHFPSFYINVLEKFAETSSRSGTTFTDRIPRFDQSINPKIGYKWKRATFEAGFRHYVRDFRRQIDDGFDFQSVEWTGVVYYDLFARLKALVEYQVGQIDYDDDSTRQGTFHQARIGLEGEIMPNLKAKVRVGPQFRNYAPSSEKDFYSAVADIDLDYKIRENLKLNAGYSRDAVEATFLNVNFYKVHTIRFGVEYEVLPKWVLFSELNFDRHAYGESATLGGQSGYRRDHLIGSRTGVRYEFREWLDFELAYLYLRRNSNFSAFDFTENEVSFSTRLKY